MSSFAARVCVMVVLVCGCNLLCQQQRREVACVPVASDSPSNAEAATQVGQSTANGAGAPSNQPSAATIDSSLAPAAALSAGHHKTADLIPLITETLHVNNRTSSSASPPAPPESGHNKHPAKDEWTFDMVEYDLMDFLQDLSARYQMLVGNDTVRAGPNLQNHYESQPAISKHTSADELAQRSHHQQQQQQQHQSRKQLANTRPPGANAPQHGALGAKSGGAPVAPTASTGAPELQISVASSDDDRDISESKWQYGIFDRFTRARASTSTTTPEPSFNNVLAGAAGYEARQFNTDECGLRVYDENVRAFLDESEQAADNRSPGVDEAGVATKELSLRRQRPPEVGTFFHSHKKHASSVSSHQAQDLDSVHEYEASADRKLNDVPPLDRNGATAAANSHKISTLAEDLGPESEFNLALRRQWLQQQLGNTLQMLGYNSTSSSSSSSLLTPGAGQSATNETQLDDASTSVAGIMMRENMMKVSSKSSKSLTDAADILVDWPPSGGVGANANANTNANANANKRTVSEQDLLKARQDELKLEARVIGGSDARLGDSPWSVSLQALVTRPGTGSMEYRHYCGGTIIAEHYILTAAHCLDFMVGRESRLFVVVGDLNWRMSTTSLYGRRFGVDKLIIHSGYKSTAFGHDIGLIRTRDSMKPLKVNGRYIINSVCLPERNVEHTGEAELVGWGLFSNRNEMADSLQIVDVPILPRPLCVDLYRRRTGLIQWLIGIELITDKQVCAGTFGRGICQGDSGSALVYNEKTARVRAPQPPQRLGLNGAGSPVRRTQRPREQESRATIVGTVAFGGIRRCSYQSLPGVYMQTSKYLDWILPRIQAV